MQTHRWTLQSGETSWSLRAWQTLKWMKQYSVLLGSMRKGKGTVQWYLPSPREVLAGHRFLSYPNEKNQDGRFRHQHYFYVLKGS